MTTYRTVFLLTIAVAMGVQSASAATITFFMPGGTSAIAPADNLLATGGALGDPLAGFGIDVSAVFGTGTPLNDGGGALCVGCELGFITGGLTFFDPFVDPNTWVFDGGGGLSVQGHIDLNVDGIVDPGEPAGLLLAGLFSDDAFVLNFTPGGDIEGLVFSAVIDGMHPLLTSFFGLQDQLYNGQLVLSFSAERLDFDNPANPDPAAFVSNNIGLSFLINEVPAPTTLVLLGLGLVGLTRQRRQLT